MTRHRIDWGEIPEPVSPSGAGERVLAGEGASLVMVRVPAGTRAEPHGHPHEQFVQVLSGSGELETEQGRRTFAAGSVFRIPAEAWHAALFDADTVPVETNLAG